MAVNRLGVVVVADSDANGWSARESGMLPGTIADVPIYDGVRPRDDILRALLDQLRGWALSSRSDGT